MTETGEASHAEQKSPGSALPGVPALHILTLFTLAVAHPLYDVLRHEDHAPFFFAHQSKTIDIWLLIVLLSLLIPALLFLILRLINLVAPKLARGFYATLLAVLFAVFFVQVPVKLLPETGIATAALAFLGGAAATLLYFTKAWARSLVTLMSVAVVFSPLLFLGSAPMRSFLSTPEAREYQITGRGALPDIVMLVFDELPLISLLDENREIDKIRYPNFYRMAQSATWYRNTTTSHYSTSEAMANLLVGGDFKAYLSRVHGDGAPRSGPMDKARIPGNLFTLVEEDYRVVAVELMSKLAPETKDAGEFVPPLSERMQELILDASVLYSHVVSPTRLRQFLPTMEGQWRGFLAARIDRPTTRSWPYADSFSRSSSIKQFIDSLEKTNVPSFYFLHSLLPHYPFEYNEHGQLHANKFNFMTMHFREASGVNDWFDETTANLAYQAHLLQLSFTDQLFGLILDKLVEKELWDESIVIVTSDHGTSFYWDSTNLPNEKLAEVQASGTLYVPLLIKMPGQSRGEISDKLAKTIDLVPTLADVLDVEIPWGAEGVSVFESEIPERAIRAALPRPLEFGPVADPDDLALRRKIELFGTHSLDGLYRVGPHKKILGKPVSSFQTLGSTAVVQLRNPSQYHIVDPAGPRLPAYVEGRITNLPAAMAIAELPIAVAVNGVIRSTTATTTVSISGLPTGTRNGSNPIHTIDRASNPVDGIVHFLARLPAQSFAPGRNEVTVHAVVEDENGALLSLIEFHRE